MFKFLRANNSTTGFPEIITCRLHAGSEYKTNCPYVLNGYGLDGNSVKGTLYMACENSGRVISQSEFTALKAYRITPGMEFEAKCIKEDLPNIDVGSPLVIEHTTETTELRQSTDENISFILCEILDHEKRLVRVVAV
jgi:hypothetical protein